MIRYECDKCGLPMKANDSSRFIVKMEVFAAAGHVDLDSGADPKNREALADVLKQLASADPDEIENRTYRCFRFDVCDRCRRALLDHPLG